ncbi:MAG: alpha/beta hydrolase, partial [Alphaproteobacteria bacterium]|nr:alpha/beta hydrolase [Alphaproteobacteria bacterium]
RERGFTVATLDWRGQGGSLRALSNPMKCHVEDFSEYDLDVEALLNQVVVPISSDAPVALAHSMGAHNLVRTLHARPGAFSRAVLCAPMIAVSTRGTPSFFARAVTALMNRRGVSDNWVWGMGSRDPMTLPFAGQQVTSDEARYLRTQALILRDPQIRLAGPTWGWLEAAYRSMRDVTAPGYPESISTPALVFGAGRDRVCLTPAARAFARRLAHGRYVEIEDAEHEILMENDSIRTRFWKAFDEFCV